MQRWLRCWRALALAGALGLGLGCSGSREALEPVSDATGGAGTDGAAATGAAGAGTGPDGAGTGPAGAGTDVAVTSGAAGTAAGGSTDAGGDAADADPACKDVAVLRLSGLVVDSRAPSGGAATLHVDLSTSAAGGVATYPGAVLECTELGTLVTSINGDGAWLYAVLPGHPSRLRFSVQLSMSALSGAIVHCTAHAATLSARHCANADTLAVTLEVQ